MSEFKIGDLVECINFEGASGKLFSPNTAYQIKDIIGPLGVNGRRLLCFNILDLEELNGAYSYRFIPFCPKKTSNIDEYDDIIEAQNIYKFLVNG